MKSWRLADTAQGSTAQHSTANYNARQQSDNVSSLAELGRSERAKVHTRERRAADSQQKLKHCESSSKGRSRKFASELFQQRIAPRVRSNRTRSNLERSVKTRQNKREREKLKEVSYYFLISKWIVIFIKLNFLLQLDYFPILLLLLLPISVTFSYWKLPLLLLLNFSFLMHL